MEKFILSPDHKPFIKVVKGGSCCANCRFLTEDKRHCGNTYFVKWYGKSLLPKEIDSWCSDYYEPNPEYLEKGGKITVKAPYYHRKKKKKEHVQALAGSIKGLRSSISKDIKLSEGGEIVNDEKTFLTALVISVMDKTAERVGNEGSEETGHFGITGLRKRHITIEENTVTLHYKGKSGVMHEKTFTSEPIANALAIAIENSPKRSIFVTSDGFRIKADRINWYLEDYNITAKDLRGYHANKYILDHLSKKQIAELETERKKDFKKAVKLSAEKVGHGAATLQKHYLIPEVEEEYIQNGKIMDLKDLSTNDGIQGGLLEGDTHAQGGIKAIVTDTKQPVELETGEAIINANSMADPTSYVVEGTPSEIASAINEVGGGVTFDPGANIDVAIQMPIDPEYSEEREPYQVTFEQYSQNIDTKNKRNLAKKFHTKAVQKALDEMLYNKEILNGSIEPHTVFLIIESADLEIPSEISNLAATDNYRKANETSEKLSALEKETIVKAKEFKKTFTKKEISETIDGLKIAMETATGKKKADLQNSIDGLDIMLETMPETMEREGYALYKNGQVINEYYS